MDRTSMFTFGPDHHGVRNAAVVIHGVDPDEARKIMFALYGQHWSHQYDGREEIDRYSYPVAIVRRISVGAPTSDEEMSPVRAVYGG